MSVFGRQKKHLRDVGVCAGVLCFLLAACATPRRMKVEVAREREEAATRWVQKAPAEEGPLVVLSGPLTWEEAVRLALQHSKELQIARKQQEIARGRVLESHAAALPNVTGSANYTRLDEVSQIEAGPQKISLGFEHNYSAQVNVRQPLFHGDAIPSALRVAQLYALWSDEAVRAVEQAVIFQVAQQYYDALLAQILTRVKEDTLRFAETMLRDVAQKRDAGVSTDYDVLRAEVEVSNARAEYIQQKNQRDLTMSRLYKTMGVSPFSEVELAGDFQYVPQSVDTAMWLKAALKNRAELLQAEYGVRMQFEALKIARSAYWPQVDAFLTQKWSNPDPHNSTRDTWGDAWSAGISVTLPLFDGHARRGKVIQESAALDQARTRLKDAEESVALEVRQAVLGLQNAEELVRSQEMNLKRAEEGLRLVQSGYRQGTKTEVDVLDAQTALSRTQALYHQALYAHVMARVNLRRAIGLLDAERYAEAHDESGKVSQDESSEPSIAEEKRM